MPTLHWGAHLAHNPTPGIVTAESYPAAGGAVRERFFLRSDGPSPRSEGPSLSVRVLPFPQSTIVITRSALLARSSGTYIP